MKVLVFDTETTGLPKKRNTSIYETDNWPYIVQLSYILYDTCNNYIIDMSDNIIKLDENISIPEESTKIHKITNEISRNNGINIKNALYSFVQCVKLSDRIIGHNVNFDKNMVIVEAIRNNYKYIFKRNQEFYCTMRSSRLICKLSKNPNSKLYKFPKLIELFTFYFNDEDLPKNLHNSMVDVLITLRCYGMLVDNTDYTKKCGELSNYI